MDSVGWHLRNVSYSQGCASMHTTKTNLTARRLIASGAILFVLGLLTGFAIPAFQNPRMGLSSHLEGVMNGTFLIALGAAWSHVVLGRNLERLAFWLILYGCYANWFFVSLAAVVGTSKMTPIAGEGYAGSAMQEQFVSGGLISVGITMLAGCVIVVVGLFRHRKET